MFSFSEDMLPRHFPRIHRSKSLQPLGEAARDIPQPTLPAVSLLYSCENGVKSQQSHRKWNDRQYNAILQNDSMKHQAKSVKKYVRFVAANGDTSRHISTDRNVSDVRSKLEFNYCESQQPRRIKSEVADDIKQTPFEKGCPTSEITRENCWSRSRFLPRDHQHQLYANDPSKVAHLQADSVGFGPREMVSEQHNRSNSSYEILLNILEEQQHHISMQRNQILMQEKQNLEQQKEICMLEYQVQQLLLQKEAVVIQSYQPPSMTNVLKTKSDFPPETPMDFGCKMSRFLKDTNNDKNAKNFGISHVTNVALSSERFVFDAAYGEANTEMFFNRINEPVSSNPHSSVRADGTSCSSYEQAQLTMDRSLVFNKLRIKYECSEVEKSLNSQRLSEKENTTTAGGSNFPDDVPFYVYDYLVRHGLIKRQI